MHDPTSENGTHKLQWDFVGTSGGVMVSKIDYQTFTSEFESHWGFHSYGLVPRLSKNAL